MTLFDLFILFTSAPVYFTISPFLDSGFATSLKRKWLNKLPMWAGVKENNYNHSTKV